MTDSMVERVARALVVELTKQAEVFKAFCGMEYGEHSGDEFTPPHDGLYDGFISAAGLAKAALEAMREPTEAVGDALDRVPGGWGRGAWAEGIDAALAEKE